MSTPRQWKSITVVFVEDGVQTHSSQECTADRPMRVSPRYGIDHVREVAPRPSVPLTEVNVSQPTQS